MAYGRAWKRACDAGPPGVDFVNDAVQLQLALGAFALGLAFGAIVERTGFCTMGAVSDVVAFGDWRRARAWMLAVALAVGGTELLRWSGPFDPSGSIYLAPRLSWAGALVGGGALGFGMMLSGGCVSRNLVRLGGGDLRAGVVLIVLGLCAYATQHGLTAPARVALERATDLQLDAFGGASQGLPELAQRLAPGLARLRPAAAVLVATLLAAACLASAAFRRSPRNVLGGLGVGAAVVAGWWVSGVFGVDEFQPSRPASLTFTAPVGNAIVYLITFTGARLDFGICAVGGTVLGAAMSAAAAGRVQMQGFADLHDLVRNLAGAALMGTGGVLALGCTIGQGVSGLSTLSAGSVLATAAIVAGGVAGVRFLERGA
jgi:uncharacterized protein